MLRFVVFQRRDGQWTWRVTDKYGQIVSEGHCPGRVDAYADAIFAKRELEAELRQLVGAR